MNLRAFIITFVWLLPAFHGYGKPVTKAEVSKAVYGLLAQWNRPGDAAIVKMEAQYLPDGSVACYLVDLGKDGWVVVSGDDVVQPVLAFSFENRLSAPDQWADAAAYLLNIYREEIRIAAKDPRLNRDLRWDREQLSTQKSTSEDIYIDPIIEVTWDQSAGWNMFCPYDVEGPGNHAYVGCVAVAMAQAMSVYGYPAYPVGKKSYLHDTYGSITVNYDYADPYRWNQMGSSSYDSSNALLLYHCAVAVEMDFGADGSGAFVRTAASAMKQYFSYSKNLSFLERFEDQDQWESLLLNEIQSGRPIVYRGEPGDGTAGHAWNVDGYGAGYFHMNFGWSGSQNGYYTLNLINPGSYDFSLNQGAMIGIVPPASAPTDLSLSAESVDEGLPVGSLVATVSVEDEDPNNTYTYTCKGKYNILIRDYEPSSFYIEEGRLLTGEVLTYNVERPDLNSEFLLIIVEDQSGNKYQEEFRINIRKVYQGPVGIALSDSTVKENQPLGTAVGRLLIEDEDTGNSYTYTLYGPYNTDISGFETPSFYVQNDTLKTSVVFDLELSDTCYVRVEMEDAHGFHLSRPFTIRIKSDQSGSTGLNKIHWDSDLFYPNPASHSISFTNPGRISSFELYEASSGRMVIREEKVEGRMDVSGYPEGLYLVVIRSEGGLHAQKLLISR